MFTFFLISLALALTPGPDNLYVLTQSVAKSAKAGFVITAGLCSGLVLHTLAAAFGLSLFFKTNPAAFAMVQTAGSLYLLYLAFAILSHSGAHGTPDVRPARKQLRSLYFKGIVMNVTNPKVLIFFLAFLPQFIDQAQPLLSQTLLYGVLFIAATILAFGSLSLAAQAIKPLFASPRFMRLMDLATAAIFVLLALKLFTSELL